MGKLEAFGILFTDDTSVYNSGDVITGEVIVELSDAMRMKGIHLYIHGLATVYWVEGYDRESHDRKKTQSYHHQATESYMEESITLFGQGVGDHGKDDNPHLPAGIHSFAFEYQIPRKTMPCSFEGKFGFVRYYLRAVIHKPWKFDHVTKRAFTLLGEPYDINEEEHALVPVHRSCSRGLCCLCCRTGPIAVEVWTDRHAYCPGESILISAEIDNRSNRAMEMTTATLRQFVTYHASSHKSRTSIEDLFMIRGEAIPPRSSDQWDKEMLQIPPLPPSELRHCRIIEIVYDIEFTVFISGVHFKNIVLHLPIKIGNVPLKELTKIPAQVQTPDDTTQETKEDDGAAITTTDGDTQLDILKHEYGECVKGAANIKDEKDSDFVMGNLSFTPVYLVYKFIKKTKDTVNEKKAIEGDSVAKDDDDAKSQSLGADEEQTRV